MDELRTYKDFADDDYRFFMVNYNNNYLFNSMGAMAQSICERYLKHLISEFYEPETQNEETNKQRVLHSHNLNTLSNHLRSTINIQFPRNLDILLNVVNGFYFSTRYPGDDSTVLTKQNLDDCAEAIKLCKQFTENIIEELSNETGISE